MQIKKLGLKYQEKLYLFNRKNVASFYIYFNDYFRKIRNFRKIR